MPLSFTAPTAATIRDNILRTIKNALLGRGVANPNVNQGSDNYILAQAVGNEQEVVSLNTVVAADQLMPDTAVGLDLARIMAIYGLAPRGAGASSGSGVFATSSPTLVSTGALLLDPNANQFRVLAGGLYSNTNPIPVQSVGVGSATNLAGGTVLKWVSPPPYAAPTMALNAFGASGGVDQENDDTARARLLSFLANYPAGGNSAYVNAQAEQADAAIQKSFTYPAANGPGTVHAAVCGYATASFARSRVVPATSVTNAINAIANTLPEYVESVITSTVDQAADASFLLQLPVTGAAGSWNDPNPWPSVKGATNAYAQVTADIVPASNAFAVQSMTAPVLGQSVGWIDRDTFTLHTSTIAAVGTTFATPSGGTPGRYGITLATPFVSTLGNLPVSGVDFIFPISANTLNYVNAILAAFANLGPYEKTTAAALLIPTAHSYRQPRNFQSWDYTIGDAFLRAMSNAGQEVLSVKWGWQNGGTTVPALPTNIANGPNVFVPRALGFYPQ